MQASVLFISLFLCSGVFPATPKDILQDVLARMDQAAGSFQSMTAKPTWVTHTDVINENTTESGNIVMKKVAPDQVEALMGFTEPASARRTVTISRRKLQIYFPKIKTLQVYDLGKGGEQIDQFIMLGFGTSGVELAKSFQVRVMGEEPLNGQPAVKLELIPKSEDVKKYVTKIEMWVPDQGAPYPSQEKIYEPSADYRLVTYSDVRINPPLKSDALKLNLPSGVKTEYPQK
jgi:outer membrane lipoprotein-sorting protein